MGSPSSTLKLTPHQVLYLRLRGQALVPSLAAGPDPEGRVARQVCGLQAQDLFAASLGVWRRCSGATLDDVERARAEKRTLIWTWLMRGTLHLVCVEDLDWLLPLVGPVLSAAEHGRRLQLGLDDDACARAMKVIRREIAGNGPRIRSELTRALAAAGLPTGYSPERHLLYRAALDGLVCIGPDRGAKPTYVLVEDWIGRPLKPARGREALARLAERYLAAYGPAGPPDLAAWSGLPSGMVREAWDAAASQFAEVDADGNALWLPRSRLEELDGAGNSRDLPDEIGAARLLPAFDNYLLGYRDREHVLDRKFMKRIFLGSGIISGMILVDGRVAGAWKPNRKGRRVEVTLEPFRKLPAEALDRLQTEIQDIERFVRPGGSESPSVPGAIPPRAVRPKAARRIGSSSHPKPL